ncbi:MAG: AAA family ATPase [bacterium]|nr:AAA family ATPase [bacterium]
MIITISGAAGSGKSTVARLIAKALKIEHYSVGDLMRELAEEKGITLLELSKLAETDTSIDKQLDDKQIALGKSHDNFVIDSRLGFYFIPNSVKVFLKVTPEEAVKRVFKAKRSLEKENTTLEKTREAMDTREKSEQHRYKKYYGIGPIDETNFDLVVDTTGGSADKVAKTIIESIEK